MGIFSKSNSVNEELRMDAMGVRRAVRRYQSGQISVGELLDCISEVQQILDEETLHKLHSALWSETHLKELVSELTRKATDEDGDSEFGEEKKDVRSHYLRTWVASTLLAHGPPEFRVNMFKSVPLLEEIIDYYIDQDDEVQTSLVTKVLVALHEQNDGKLAEVMAKKPDSVRAIFNSIQCSTVANLIPQMLVDLKTSHRYPFNFGDIHKRSAGILVNADVYDLLSFSFVRAASRKEYTLEDIKIMENSSHALAELASRMACLPHPIPEELSSYMAESARMYYKARAGLDLYAHPISLERLIAAGFIESKRDKEYRNTPLECVLKALLLLLQRYEEGLRCRFSIAKAIKETDTKAFTDTLRSYLPDFEALLSKDKLVAESIRFMTAEMLCLCLSLFPVIALDILRRGFHHQLIAWAQAQPSGLALQLIAKTFNAVLKEDDQEMHKLWLDDKPFLHDLIQSVVKNPQDQKQKEGESGLNVYYQHPALSLKSFLQRKSGTEEEPLIREWIGEENMQLLSSVSATDLEHDICDTLPVLYEGKHPKVLLDKSWDDSDGMSEADRQSIMYYSLLKHEETGTNKERLQKDAMEDVMGGLGDSKSSNWLGSIFGNSSSDVETNREDREGAASVDQADNTARDGRVRHKVTMDRAGSESSKQAQRRSRAAFTMGRAMSESSTLAGAMHDEAVGKERMKKTGRSRFSHIKSPSFDEFLSKLTKG